MTDTDRREIERINAAADELNAEMEEVLAYQALDDWDAIDEEM